MSWASEHFRQNFQAFWNIIQEDCAENLRIQISLHFRSEKYIKYIKQHKEKSHSSHLHHKGSNEKEKSIKQFSFIVRNHGITVSDMPSKPFIFSLCITMSIHKVNTKGNTFITITNKVLRNSSNCSSLCYLRVKINHSSEKTAPLHKKAETSTMEKSFSKCFQKISI